MFWWIAGPVTAVFCIYHLYQAVFWAYCLFLRRQNWCRYQPRGPFHSWALVTGATEGIGLAFCHVHVGGCWQ